MSMSKKRLLEKINGLMLLTNENVEKLRRLVQKTNKEFDLLKIEKFIDQEASLLEEIFKKTLERGIKSGDTEFLKNVEKIFKEAKKDLFQISHIEEHSEKASEEENAEALLKNF